MVSNSLEYAAVLQNLRDMATLVAMTKAVSETMEAKKRAWHSCGYMLRSQNLLFEEKYLVLIIEKHIISIFASKNFNQIFCNFFSSWL